MIKIPLVELQVHLEDIFDYVREKHPDLPKEIDAVELLYPNDMNKSRHILHPDQVRLHIRFSNREDVERAVKEAELTIKDFADATKN